MADKHSVAIVIWDRGAGRVLSVLRPNTPDDELPGLWGLPAVTLRSGEDPPVGAVRCGREKLGLEVAPIAVMGETEAERPSGRICLTLVEARALTWPPRLPERSPEIKTTLYDAWAWKYPEELRQTADAGSLCCRLLLERIESG